MVISNGELLGGVCGDDGERYPNSNQESCFNNKKIKASNSRKHTISEKSRRKQVNGQGGTMG